MVMNWTGGIKQAVELNNEPREEEHVFKYLGSCITDDASDDDLRARVGLVKAVFWQSTDRINAK